MIKAPETLSILVEKKSTAILLFLLALSFVFSFSDIFVKILSNINNSTGLYSILIIAISLFLIWDRRVALISTDPSPSIFWGSALTACGLAILVVSYLSNTFILMGIALILTTLGLIWLVLGWKHFNMLLIPICYLAFAFYFFEEILGLATNSLQLFAAQLAKYFLYFFNIPVIISGIYLEMPHITLEVARVCNGVNHIVALVALSFPVAITMFASMWLKVSLVVLAFLVGIILNGLRVALIGVWTLKFSADSVHGPLEILYVSFILGVGVIFMGAVTVIANKFGLTRVSKPASHITVSGYGDFIKKVKKLPIVIAVILFASALFYTSFLTGRSVNLLTPLDSFPQEIDEWVGVDVADQDWPFKNLAGDHQLRRLYTSPQGDISIGLTISYFTHQNQNNEIINQSLLWLHNKEELINIELNDGRPFVINTGRPRGLEEQSYEGDQRVFYFFYYANEKSLTNPYRVKWESFVSELLSGSSPGALIVFSTENDGPVDQRILAETERFIAAAVPVALNIVSNGNYSGPK